MPWLMVLRALYVCFGPKYRLSSFMPSLQQSDYLTDGFLLLLLLLSNTSNIRYSQKLREYQGAIHTDGTFT